MTGPQLRAVHEVVEGEADVDRVAKAFCGDIHELRELLDEVPADLANVAWRQGGWTRKQILGHLLDSAANNRQRFVRAAIDGSYAGPSYAQDAWVAAHGYAHLSWKTLVEWWKAEHDILLAVVERIPEERMKALCTVGTRCPCDAALPDRGLHAPPVPPFRADRCPAGGDLKTCAWGTAK